MPAPPEPPAPGTGAGLPDEAEAATAPAGPDLPDEAAVATAEPGPPEVAEAEAVALPAEPGPPEVAEAVALPAEPGPPRVAEALAAPAEPGLPHPPADAPATPRLPGSPAPEEAEPPGELRLPDPPDRPPPPAADLPAPDPALFEHALRIAEALVFASDRPVPPARLQSALPQGCDARAVLTALAARCAGRPVELVEVAGGFAFRTAPELAPALTRVVEVPRRLPRAAMETLAIIAYHQPVTRAEVEEIRGASLSQSTLESLLEMGLIAPRGRKEVPGRPSLWGTTPRFLEQFGLKSLADLPRREELVNEPAGMLPLSAATATPQEPTPSTVPGQ